MKNFFANLSGKKSAPSNPPADPMRDIVFFPAMRRFEEVDPEPDKKHFIKAFAFALGLHTTIIVEGCLLNPAIPDWEKVGRAGAPGAINSFASYFGLRLAYLACQQMKTIEKQDEVGKRMVEDMWYVANRMFGQDEAALAAYEKYNKLEQDMSNGETEFNSAQLLSSLTMMLDELLGLKPSETFESVGAFTACVNKSACVAGAIAEARSSFFGTIDNFMAKKT